MTTPNAMPKRNNGLFLQLLGQLTETKVEKWSHKTIDPATGHEKKPNVIKRTVENTVLRFPLARNVSEVNVERAARKFAA